MALAVHMSIFPHFPHKAFDDRHEGRHKVKLEPVS
jgi:hypothetical protein